MKFSIILVLAVAATLVSGCSKVSGLLGGNDRAVPTAQPQIAVNNELAMPPDLALATPGTRPAASRAAAPVDDLDMPLDDAPVAAAPKPVAPAAAQDPYEKYGISKLNPDGTKKDEGKLREELRQAVLAEKRKKNPKHGTIFNVGELFQD